MKFSSRLVGELQAFERQDQDDLLREVLLILGSDKNNYHKLIFDEEDRIISVSAIRKLCLKYRLRFLDLRHFRGDIPEEATAEIKRIETDYSISLDQLKIIAPGELFELERREKDPILLAKIFENQYIIVHKWGGEINSIRKLQALPLRNITTMLLTLGLLALACSLAFLPFFGGSETPYKIFGMGFAVLWAGFISYALFISISQNVFPSSLTWNSRFLD